MRAARCLAFAVLALHLSASAEVPGFDGGHIKTRWQGSSYPDDSVFRDVFGSRATDVYADIRLNFSARKERISLRADYQLIGQWGDSLDLPTEGTGPFLLPPALPDDDLRWWDLSDNFSSGGRRAGVQRLDRLSLSYTGDKTVLRVGRQAVSWGNGLIFNPVDFFNPFSPAAVDTEYKLGEDMFYGQYLLDSGSDWQAVFVQRRDEQGRATSEQRSTALKFHGFGTELEYDLLLAENFDQLIVGMGGVTNLGEAVVRGDVTFTDARDGWVTNLVANWSWSWIWGGRNATIVLEYYYNGFGLPEGDYSAQEIVNDPDLLQRLQRGELFTIGRHNFAGSVLVELTPLLDVTGNLFANLEDGSALSQVVARWNLAQDWQLLVAGTLPLGSKGTEYGGVETGVDDLTLAVGPSALVQLDWFF